MHRQFPEHDVIGDVGRGSDYRRRGLVKLMHAVRTRDVDEVVVIHPHQLSTTTYNHLCRVMEYYGIPLRVLGEGEDSY